MPLFDKSCKSAKPKEKPYKLYDSGGLYLEVVPSGGKYWRLKYRFNKKEKRLAIGVYPRVSLQDARFERDKAKELLQHGIDPSQQKKELKRQKQVENTNSFEGVAREWHKNQMAAWTERHARYVMKRLEADIFPEIGHRVIGEIKPIELLEVIKKIEQRGALDIAKRALQTCGQIYRYAVIHEKALYDITPGLKAGLAKAGKVKHHAALSEKELPEFLDRLEVYDGDIQTKLALKMLVLTFVRTTELRGARWEEIDFAKAEWRIPAARMKMKEEHIVPLSKQALSVLTDLKKLNGNWEHVFISRTHPQKCMSNNTMLYAMYRLGYHSRATPHGFRATASTILNEHGFRADVIERQLAHSERNNVRAAYNHAQYLKERKEINLATCL